jgi:hypothetical protein
MTYLRTLLDTGNASLAAEVAGVSRDWAYKKRRQDPWFDALCREMMARFREAPAVSDLSAPPHPALRATLSREGRGAERVRINRPRAGGWNAGRERRFLAVLAATRRLDLATAAVGMRPPAAWRRRQAWPGFAQECARVLREGDPELEGEWLFAMTCMLDGVPVPPDNAVRTVTVAEAIEVCERDLYPQKPRRGRPPV